MLSRQCCVILNPGETRSLQRTSQSPLLLQNQFSQFSCGRAKLIQQRVSVDSVRRCLQGRLCAFDALHKQSVFLPSRNSHGPASPVSLRLLGSLGLVALRLRANPGPANRLAIRALARADMRAFESGFGCPRYHHSPFGLIFVWPLLPSFYAVALLLSPSCQFQAQFSTRTTSVRLNGFASTS